MAQARPGTATVAGRWAPAPACPCRNRTARAARRSPGQPRLPPPSPQERACAVSTSSHAPRCAPCAKPRPHLLTTILAGINRGAWCPRPGARRQRTGSARRGIAECLDGKLAGPAHPRDRGLGVLAELLCHPFGVPALAECPDRRGDGLAHLLGAEPLIALQRDTNKPSARTSEPPADRAVEGAVVPPGEPEEAAPVPVSSRWRKRVAEPTLGCALVPAAARPGDMCQFEDRRTQRGWPPTARYEAELRAAERHDALLGGDRLRQTTAQGAGIRSRKLPRGN